MIHASTILSSSAASAAHIPLASEAPAGVLHGAVVSAPRLILRLEGAAVLAAATSAHAALGGTWGHFAALLLVPDLSLLGYLAGPRVGAAAYNLAHGYVGPIALAAASFALHRPELLLVALVWVAHIGLDRMLGYGLKYATAFGDTHLGRVGVGRHGRARAPRTGERATRRAG